MTTVRPPSGDLLGVHRVELLQIGDPVLHHYMHV